MKIHYTDEYLMDPQHPISILVIGIGGNGTQVLTDLAKINSSLLALGHPGLSVTAMDDDVVDEPNIGRQKFSNADLGLYKGEVIVTRLNRFYGTRWKFVPEKYDDAPFKSNIVISCVDSTKAREKIYECFTSRNGGHHNTKAFYWLDFGNANDFGQFVLGSKEIKQPESKYDTVSTLKNVFDLFPDMEKNEDIDVPSCSTRQALEKQDLFINTVLVSTGMNLIWKLLTDYYVLTQGGFVNLKKCISKPIKL